VTLPRADPERPPKRLPAIPQRSIRTQKEADAPGSVPQHADDGHSVAYQRRSEKGQLGGYPELDDGGKVPPSQLGGGGADATKFLRGDQSWQVPAGGGGGPHAMESTTHTGGTRGDIAVRGASDYDLLPVGAAGDAKMSDGTDVVNLHPTVYTLTIPGGTPATGAAVTVINRLPVIRAGTVTRYRVYSWTNQGPTTSGLTLQVKHYNSAGTLQWTESSLTLAAGSNDTGDTALGTPPRTIVAGGYFELLVTSGNGTAVNVAIMLYDQ